MAILSSTSKRSWLAAPARLDQLSGPQTDHAVTAPGVPDLYQGSELWDLSLVDPDNRRPVDFDQRRRLLAELSAADGGSIWGAEEGEGLGKLFVVSRALRVRHSPCRLLRPR